MIVSILRSGVEVIEPVHCAKTGVVEKDVNPLIEVKDSLHHHINLGALGHIHRDGKRLPPATLDLGRKRLQTIQPTGGKDNLTTFLCK